MKRLLFSFVLMAAMLSAHAQLLYKISGKGLSSPSYIVGTYHLADVSFVDSIPGMRQAMADCQQVYGELMMDELFAPDSLALMQQAMMLPEGMTLDSLLNADEMNRLNAYMRGLLGVDMTSPQLAQQMGRLIPSALTTTFSLLNYAKKSGKLDVQNGFDQYFQKDAVANGKNVGGLETMAFQIKTVFGGQTLERQKELLMCMVDNTEFMDKLTDDVVRAFYAQDINAIKEAMDRKMKNSCDSRPEEDAALIDNRNAEWVKKMPALMAQKPTLFAVGAGHLPGQKGVLNLLRQAGYKVEGVIGQPKQRIVEDGGTGPYKAVMKQEPTLWAHTVFVPQDLSVFNSKNPLPVLVWGNGACTDSPWEHYKFLNEIASHGFIVVATGHIPMEEKPYRGPMSTTEQQIESMDWVEAQNADPASPYYQKIDVKNICVAGMSCGGLQTLYNCADPRITTLMVCNSGLFNQQNRGQAVGGMPMPTKDKLNEIHTPIIYILGGETDIAYGNGMDDFHRISHVPACATNFPVGHGGTYREPHGGEFSVVALAWLQWQLKGDKKAAKMFKGKNCLISKRQGWTIEKNQKFGK